MHLDCTTLLESFPRFWSKVDIRTPEECWEWLAAKKHHGYGRFFMREEGRIRRVRAHRLSYTLVVGEIPVGLELDHLCRNTSCVNPNHLEAVTHRENVRRGLQGVLKTHCSQGHIRSEDNIYTNPGSGTRSCRICQPEWERRYQAKKKREAIIR